MNVALKSKTRPVAANSVGSVAPTYVEVNGVRVYPEFIKMSDFEKLPQNTKQRNHVIRKALHLQTPLPEHVVVAIVRDKNGVDTKVDGHTRAHVSKIGKVTAPEYVLAIVYHVVDEAMDARAEGRRLYSSYDSRQQTKTPRDEIQGALNEHNIVFNTEWMAIGDFSSILGIVAKFVRTAPQGSDAKVKTDRVSFFREELLLLDSIIPIKMQFPIGFGAAAIMFLREFGPAGVVTVQNYNNGMGMTLNGEHDPLQRIKNYRTKQHMDRTMTGYKNNMAHAQDVYEFLRTAHRTSALDARVARFDATAFANRVK